MPLVTVVIPCYNQGRFVREAITSVLKQVHKDVEVIVVNDGSTDNSQKEIETCIAGHTSARLINQANRGVSAARNVGASKSSKNSKYLLFLDADDFLHPEMISHAHSYLEDNGNVGAVFTRFQSVTDDGALIGVPKDYFAPVVLPTTFGIERRTENVKSISFFTAFTDTVNLPSNTVIRRDTFKKVGAWNEQLPQLVEDKDLFMRLTLWSQLHFINEGLIYRRYHDDQATNDLQRISDAHSTLINYWKYLVDNLSDEDRKIVEDAFCTWSGRVIAGKSLRAAKHHLRNGRLVTSLRDLFYSLRLYFSSL